MLKRADSVKQLTMLDDALSVAEKYVDKYLPDKDPGEDVADKPSKDFFYLKMYYKRSPGDLVFDQCSAFTIHNIIMCLIIIYYYSPDLYHMSAIYCCCCLLQVQNRLARQWRLSDTSTTFPENCKGVWPAGLLPRPNCSKNRDTIPSSASCISQISWVPSHSLHTYF